MFSINITISIGYRNTTEPTFSFLLSDLGNFDLYSFFVMSGKVSHVVLFEFDSRYSKELQEQVHISCFIKRYY